MNWHEVLDYQMDLHKFTTTRPGRVYYMSLLSDLLGIPEEGFGEQVLVAMADKHARFFQEVCYRADTVHVTSDMQAIISSAAKTMPDEVTLHPSDLLTTCGFLLTEDGFLGVDVRGIPVVCTGFAWKKEIVSHAIPATEEIVEREEVMLYFLVDGWDERDEVSTEILQDQRLMNLDISMPRLGVSHVFILPCDGERPFSWPADAVDVQGSDMVRDCVRWFLAFHLIAQEKIADRIVQVPRRATRKRAVKWDRHNERYISLITLRRRSVKRDEPQEVDWAHRWVVTGHWRKQWYPKEKVHRWKYIAEHIKGPEDKPLLIRERRVFNLER